MEYATQDADPKVFEPLRKPIDDRAAALPEALVDTEPKQLDAAARVRRPGLPPAADRPRRRTSCAASTRKLREQELPHDEAFRLTLARVLVAPAFLYRVETAGRRAEPRPGRPTGSWPAG